jgi:hypothetical protein
MEKKLKRSLKCMEMEEKEHLDNGAVLKGKKQHYRNAFGSFKNHRLCLMTTRGTAPPAKTLFWQKNK